ncbi:MAG: rhomboid family intramembrane serine protease [Dehalococcoidia bacterium]
MFPIRDLSRTHTTALVTIAVVALNLVAFFAWQPRELDESIAFLYQRAAIACELIGGAPVSVQQLEAGRCVDDAGARPIFPDKGLALSVLVSMFLHGGLLHLLGNLWFFWIFGNNVEEAFGHVGFTLLYLLSGVAATAAFVLLRPDSVQPLIGASGAVAGVLGAYFVLFPTHLILAVWFLGLVPVPAVVFLGLWFFGQFSVADPGVAWEAHVAGFVVGATVALLLRGALLRRVRRLHGAARAPIW